MTTTKSPPSDASGFLEAPPSLPRGRLAYGFCVRALRRRLWKAVQHENADLMLRLYQADEQDFTVILQEEIQAEWDRYNGNLQNSIAKQQDQSRSMAMNGHRKGSKRGLGLSSQRSKRRSKDGDGINAHGTPFVSRVIACIPNENGLDAADSSAAAGAPGIGGKRRIQASSAPSSSTTTAQPAGSSHFKPAEQSTAVDDWPQFRKGQSILEFALSPSDPFTPDDFLSPYDPYTDGRAGTEDSDDEADSNDRDFRSGSLAERRRKRQIERRQRADGSSSSNGPRMAFRHWWGGGNKGSDFASSINSASRQAFTTGPSLNGPGQFDSVQLSMNGSNLSGDHNGGHDVYWTTPLHEAARLGSGKLMRWMLERTVDEADPNIKNGRGRTALHMVCGGMTTYERVFQKSTAKGRSGSVKKMATHAENGDQSEATQNGGDRHTAMQTPVVGIGIGIPSIPPHHNNINDMDSKAKKSRSVGGKAKKAMSRMFKSMRSSTKSRQAQKGDGTESDDLIDDPLDAIYGPTPARIIRDARTSKRKQKRKEKLRRIEADRMDAVLTVLSWTQQAAQASNGAAALPASAGGLMDSDPFHQGNDFGASNGPPSVNAVDKLGRTALHYAAETGRGDICRSILSSTFGVLLTIVDDVGARTPCELAAMHGHQELTAHLEARALLYTDPYGMEDEYSGWNVEEEYGYDDAGNYLVYDPYEGQIRQTLDEVLARKRKKLAAPFGWFVTLDMDQVNAERQRRLDKIRRYIFSYVHKWHAQQMSKIEAKAAAKLAQDRSEDMEIMAAIAALTNEEKKPPPSAIASSAPLTAAAHKKPSAKLTKGVAVGVGVKKLQPGMHVAIGVAAGEDNSDGGSDDDDDDDVKPRAAKKKAARAKFNAKGTGEEQTTTGGDSDDESDLDRKPAAKPRANVSPRTTTKLKDPPRSDTVAATTTAAQVPAQDDDIEGRTSRSASSTDDAHANVEAPQEGETAVDAGQTSEQQAENDAENASSDQVDSAVKSSTSDDEDVSPENADVDVVVEDTTNDDTKEPATKPADDDDQKLIPGEDKGQEQQGEEEAKAEQKEASATSADVSGNENASECPNLSKGSANDSEIANSDDAATSDMKPPKTLKPGCAGSKAVDAKSGAGNTSKDDTQPQPDDIEDTDAKMPPVVTQSISDCSDDKAQPDSKSRDTDDATHEKSDTIEQSIVAGADGRTANSNDVAPPPPAATTATAVSTATTPTNRTDASAAPACTSQEEIISAPIKMMDKLQNAHVEQFLSHHKWKYEDAREAFKREMFKSFETAGVDISSASPQAAATSTAHDDTGTVCMICYDDEIAEGEWQQLQGCVHGFCKPCLRDYLGDCASAKATGLCVACPHHECKSFLTTEEISSLLENQPETQSRIFEAANEQFVSTCVDTRFCPHPGCNGIVRRLHQSAFNSLGADMDLLNFLGAVCTAPSAPVKGITTLTYEGVVDPEYKNCRSLERPRVAHRFCFECGENVHWPVSCARLEEWNSKIKEELGDVDGAKANSDDVSDVAQKLWIKANTRPCPKCNVPIEKNDGCNHMTCSNPSCNHEFCWICRKDWKLHGTSTGGFFRCNIWTDDGDDATLQGDTHDDTLPTTAARANDQGFINGDNNDQGYGTAIHAARSAYKQKREMDRFLHHFTRCNAHAESAELERKMADTVSIRLAPVVEAAVEFDGNSHFNFGGKGLSFVHSAFAELLECRSVLQHSYPFSYFRYPSFIMIRRYGQLTQIRREKASFEKLQSELETMTEQMSDIVARSHLRASQFQIAFLTKGAAEKRQEFSNFLLSILLEERKEQRADATPISTADLVRAAVRARERMIDSSPFPPSVVNRMMDDVWPRNDGNGGLMYPSNQIRDALRSSLDQYVLNPSQPREATLDPMATNALDTNASAMWACDACTYMNSDGGRRCAMCGTGRSR